jgi:hypothetical protein
LSESTRWLVIDGQQRLTTLILFFKVLCLKKGYNGQGDRFAQRFTLQGSGEIALQHNHNDVEAFKKIAALQALDDIPEEGSGHQIVKCYNFFKERIDPSKLNWDILLSKIQFVAIALDEKEDEQQIFDTINSVGVRLTTAELLKNYFFKGESDLSSYERHWETHYEPRNDNGEVKAYWEAELTTGRLKRTFIDLFLSAYLQIKANDEALAISSDERRAFAKSEQLFQSYKRFIEIYLDGNKEAVLKELAEYGRLFRDNFVADDVLDIELPAEPSITRITALIFGLENSTLIPYVLFVLKNQGDKERRNSLFEYLESYIMRRIVAGSTNKHYNQMFSGSLIAGGVLTREAFVNYLDGQADSTVAMPSDKVLADAFHSRHLTNKQATGVLYLMETKIRDRGRNGTSLLGLSKYSLEHLMPKKWRQNWGSTVDANARDDKLLTLGNLVIITGRLNASIGNSAWANKQKSLRRFASGDTITPYLDLDFLEWDEASIDKRADDLFTHAQHIWPAR